MCSTVHTAKRGANSAGDENIPPPHALCLIFGPFHSEIQKLLSGQTVAHLEHGPHGLHRHRWLEKREAGAKRKYAVICQGMGDVPFLVVWGTGIPPPPSPKGACACLCEGHVPPSGSPPDSRHSIRKVDALPEKGGWGLGSYSHGRRGHACHAGGNGVCPGGPRERR